MPQKLSALALNCTLKAGDDDEPSSTGKILDDLLAEFEKHGVTGQIVRVADHAIKPGVLSDMGQGDEWPPLRRKIIDSDIFILGTPVWLGHPSSIAQRVMERLDAFLGETDAGGRMPATGKVALVAVVGNEDGAHHCHAECFQALNDVGFTIPANTGCYWVGEAMQPTDYKDLEAMPEKVRANLEMAASNAAHLARLLKAENYPAIS